MAEKLNLEQALARVGELEAQVDELLAAGKPTARIEELEAQVAALQAGTKPTARETAIRQRMTRGNISYDAAAMAVDHQAHADAQAEKEKKAAATKPATKPAAK